MLLQNELGEFSVPEPDPPYRFPMPEVPDRVKTPAFRRCKVCGKWFKPKKFDHMICSYECRKRHVGKG